MFHIFAVFAVSLIAALAFVPATRWLAVRNGWIDRPDAQRKLQSKPVALGGGLAVFAATLFGVVAVLGLDRMSDVSRIEPLGTRYFSLLVAAVVMLAVGLADDLWTIRGRQKLALQCLIATGLYLAGTRIEQLGLFGYDLDLGVFSLPITVIWLLAAINALNLIDGADGMATTVGGITLLGLGWLSLQTGTVLNGLVCLALAGSLFGFLAFNRPPASIYLGDAGSMTIGLAVGVLAVWSSIKESTVLASAPIAIFAIPLVDASAAILRRWLTGRSIYETDRAHMHHVLQKRYGNVRMLWLVGGLSFTTTTASVLSFMFDMPSLALLGVAVVLGVLIATKSFGHAEATLLVGRAVGFSQSMIVRPAKIRRSSLHRRVTMQGSGHWNDVWDQLVEFAELRGLSRIKLDLNIAWLHEGYHGHWRAMQMPEKANQMNLTMPLFAVRDSEHALSPIGRLQVTAPAHDEHVAMRLPATADFLTDLRPSLSLALAQLEQLHNPGSALPSIAADAAVGLSTESPAAELPAVETLAIESTDRDDAIEVGVAHSDPFEPSPDDSSYGDLVTAR